LEDREFPHVIAKFVLSSDALSSLASGQYGTYETISSWAWLFVAGLGNVESTITVGTQKPLRDLF
jgi:hypothetical protein